MANTSTSQPLVWGRQVLQDVSNGDTSALFKDKEQSKNMDWGLECSDEQLMLACQKGNEEALELLYDRYYKQVLGFIFRLVQDRYMAEDLVQETFLRVYNNRHSWQPRSKFTSWLFRIARNLCIDEKRRYWNRMVSMDSQFKNDDEYNNNTSFLERVENGEEGALEACANKIDEQLIRKAINQLSEEQREVIVMNKYQGLSYVEIAEIIDASPDSVKQRAYRAHLKLREILEPMLKEYK